MLAMLVHGGSFITAGLTAESSTVQHTTSSKARCSSQLDPNASCVLRKQYCAHFNETRATDEQHHPIVAKSNNQVKSEGRPEYPLVF